MEEVVGRGSTNSLGVPYTKADIATIEEKERHVSSKWEQWHSLPVMDQ